MYNIKLTDYVPEPKAVKTDYLICAHYYAAWKKGAAGLHNGFDDLHSYPERTPLAGYYDEDDPHYSDWEIKWALEHGINCFIHCWYRYKDNVGKPVTREALRCAHALHEGFFRAKYEKMMKFAIMFETNSLWGSSTPADMLENLMPFWMENYFKRGNYLIIDNKPVLFNYDWRNLAEALGEPEEQKRVFDRCRDYCRDHGFDGMIFAPCETVDYKESHDEIIARGYDFAFSYRIPVFGEETPTEDEALELCNSFCEDIVGFDPERYVPTASCFWDPEPRTTKAWLDLGFTYKEWGATWYNSPEKFREQLKNCKKISDGLPKSNVGRKIIMIDNWNEWDEGHYVAPSHKFGFAYLQAIREELTYRDNLPDYRMPQDIGLSDFNKAWTEPDLSEICKEKFEL